MHVHWRTLNEGLITLLRIFPCGVSKKPGAQGLPNLHSVPTARNDLVLVPLHDAHKLLANVLRAAHTASLDEVFKAPGVREFGILPSVINVE